MHIAAARALGIVFAAHKIKLVYGGGTVGLMGEIARTVVSLSGPDSVHGIIPEALKAFEQEGRPGAASPSNPPNPQNQRGDLRPYNDSIRHAYTKAIDGERSYGRRAREWVRGVEWGVWDVGGVI